jgi:conjugative transposon TraK protein
MDVEANEEIEAKSHINMFHSLFFTLPPDDEFIKNNISKSMYLIDESGLKQYNNLKEQGFYNTILANSMFLTIKTDSIDMNLSEPMQFTYFGTQRIERQTSIIKRRIITSGYLRKVQRSDNNPHGIIITNWKTLKNEDIENRLKKIF